PVLRCSNIFTMASGFRRWAMCAINGFTRSGKTCSTRRKGRASPKSHRGGASLISAASRSNIGRASARARRRRSPTFRAALHLTASAAGRPQLLTVLTEGLTKLLAAKYGRNPFTDPFDVTWAFANGSSVTLSLQTRQPTLKRLSGSHPVQRLPHALTPASHP